MWKVKYFVVRRGGGVAETQTCGAVSLLPLLPFAIISNKNWYRKKKFWIWVCSGFGFRHTLVARLIGVNRVSRLVGVTREIRVTAKVIRQIIPIRIEYKMWVVKLPIFRPFHYLILARDDKIMKLVNSLLIYSNSN